jgi:DNA-binding CsgD family transcriptional regulator
MRISYLYSVLRVNFEMLVELRKPSIEFHQSVNEKFNDICSPLHDLGIKGYYCFQSFRDGSHLVHVNDMDLAIDHYTTVSHEGEYFTNLIENSSYQPFQTIVNGEIEQFDPKKDPILYMAWNHDFWNVLTIARIKQGDIYQSWGFSMGRDCQNHERFFDKRIDLIKRFIAYFEIVGADLIDMSERKKLLNLDQQFQFHKNSEDEELVRMSLEFLRKTSLKGLSLQHQEQELKLTKRQGQCLYYLAQNFTIKERGRILDLSPRTVEGFLEVLKDKTKMSSKRELINLVNDNKWADTLSLLT